MPLTLEEQNARREKTIAYLAENEVRSKPILKFIEREFKYQNSKGEVFYPTHLVKDGKDKEGKPTKKGSKSSLTLADYTELSETGKVSGKDDWKPYITDREGEYWEIRPCHANKQMCIVDFDGWKTSGDITLEELFAMDELPEIFAESAFFISRTKSLPHFVFYIDDLPETIKLGQHIDVVKGFNADILFNHAWERKESLLYNYKKELSTISWNDLKLIVDSDKKYGGKLVPKPKEKKEKKAKKESVIVEDDVSEVTAVTGYDSKTAEKQTKKIQDITEHFNAIIESDPTYFDNYRAWIELGFLIFNETNGSEEGCDCFIALTGMREAPEPVPKSKVCSTYHSTQKARNKKDKLHMESLKTWLKEVNPDSPLLVVEKKSGEMTCDEIRMSEPYIEYRTKFELTHFKLNNPVRYCEMDNGVLLLRDAKPFCERMRDEFGMPTFLVKGGLVPYPKMFYELWMDDPLKLKYSRIKFDPSEDVQQKSTPEKIAEYNSFGGFPNKTGAAPINPAESAVIKLLKYVFVEDKVFEYIMCWVAAIIQRPNVKTKVAPILFSFAHGTGKNSVIDAIVAIIGKELCGVVESIEDITKNFNAHLCNKLFIYGDEISANAKKLADKLKNVITRAEQNLEKKGVDSVKVNDYTNWMFSTNTEHSFKSEEGDRRMLFSHCNEIAQTKLSIASYAEIGDKSKLEALFSYFLQYKQSPESVKKYGDFNVGYSHVISTQYKQDLLYENKPAYVKMLFKNYKDIIYSQTDKGIGASELYDMAQKFAKSNYMTSNFTSQEFSKQIQPYIQVFAARGGSRKFYKLPKRPEEWLQHLFKVDEPYYRYINQLDDDFTPTFKPPTEQSAEQIPEILDEGIETEDEDIVEEEESDAV
jgi:hypothetical protein